MSIDGPRLISRSCTTGWFDWVWGDLWLTTDCLLRINRGTAETREAARGRKRRGSTVTSDAVGGDGASATELQQKVAADKKNRRILLGEVRTARLRRGVLNSRLAVELNDGTRVKLLWLKSDPAFEILREVLGDRLGSSLTVR